MWRALLAALAILMLASSALADAADAAAAEALFREGRALMGQDNFDEACAKFSESQRLDASSGTLLNLADCYEKAGKIASAWAAFLEAARFSSRRGEDERAAEGKRRAGLLEPKLSYLTITLERRVDGLTITRDDVQLKQGALATKIPVDPGTHTIRARAPGYEDWEGTVVVGEAGDNQELSVPALTPVPEQATAEDPVGEPLSPPKDVVSPADPTLGYVVGGLGLVSAAVGGVIGWSALSSYDEADKACPTHRDCLPAAMAAADSAETKAWIANVAVGVGIAGIAVGSYLIFSGGSEPTEGSAAVEVVPTVSRHAAGLQLGGRF